ncbi:flagellar basal body P-ring formation chaperone FlgA [Colwellia sp. MEBiC06753]
MSKTNIFLTFIALCCQYSVAAFATNFDRDYLEHFAEKTVRDGIPDQDNKKVSVTANQLDPRIVIEPCDSQLSANIPENHNSRNVNVKISCDGSNPWFIYVPVKVSIEVPVLVAKQAIDKGSVLTQDNVAIEYQNESQLRGEVLKKQDDAIGAKAKRNIYRGRAISPNQICTVCKGDSVTLVASSSLIEIKTEGTSISDGHLGDEVKVKNNRSGKLVTGLVTDLNKVTIIL